MKQFFLFMLITASTITVVFAQQPSPTPASTPMPQATPAYTPPGLRLSGLGDSRSDGRVNLTPTQAIALRQLLVQKYAQPLYRKPTDSELGSIAPSPDVVRKYKEFLDRENTGIFKLVEDAGCANNAQVVVATEQCLKYTMPGSGNSYSFRTANYRIRHLADLMLAGGNLRIPGIMMHGMMTNLGDVAIESVSLRTRGLDFLTEFKPSNQFERAMAIEQIVGTGLERDGFIYARFLAVQDNTTYALRVVAYDGKVLRAVPGASYNEMDFDRRRDVVVAFRVVRKDADGSVTIVWVELSDVDSPTLKMPAAASGLGSRKE